MSSNPRPVSPYPRPTSFENWLTTIPEDLTADSLWDYVAYQKALFLHDLVWFDCELLMKDPRGLAIVKQIMTAGGSISANIEEGYSKGFGLDYARYLTIALGSARETRGWYWRGRRLLPPDVLQHRFALLKEIIALLKTTIPQQRRIGKKKKSENS
jgi:four helix bundle protein